MIDFEKELKNFKFFELDIEFIELRNETSRSVEVFNSTLKRLRKEQSDIVFQMEEIVGILDEIKADVSNANEIKRSFNEAEEEKITLIKGFINAIDQFEDLYRFISRREDETWKGQLDMLWNNVSGILMSLGVTRIENLNTIFNPKINAVKSLVYNCNLPDGMVTEIVRSGYIYKAEVLRKAEVIVNKNEKEGTINE